MQAQVSLEDTSFGFGWLSPRSIRARQTHVPMTKSKYEKARYNERRVARLLNGKTTPVGEPFDVVIKDVIGVEVKTKLDGKVDRVTVHPSSRLEKEQQVLELGLKKVYTVVFDQRLSDEIIYYRQGVGSFRLSTFTKVSSMKDLKRALLQ